MKIREITEEDYHYLVDWNKKKDAAFLQQWAGPLAYLYPISQKQIAERVDDNHPIYMVEKDGVVIGSFEMDINEGKKQAFISRVLFDEANHQKGYGTMAMKKLLEMAFSNEKINKVILHVYCFNTLAIHCYENAGFRVIEYLENEQYKWNSFTMECRKNK